MSDPFHDFVSELPEGMGPVTIKRMFGGAGVYADGVMFGLIAGDTLHLKVDDALKAELTQEGSGPFVWEPQNGPRKGERVDMGYWRLPESALDEPGEVVEWAKKALSVARAKAAAKPKRKKKT
ncbi:MAG: TfoX/Sxy family protein [Hyphomonadaceae bacterium]